MNRLRRPNVLRHVHISLILIALTLPLWLVTLSPPYPPTGRLLLRVFLLILVELGCVLLHQAEAEPERQQVALERAQWLASLQNGVAPDSLQVYHRGRVWQVRRDGETYTFTSGSMSKRSFTLQPSEIRGIQLTLGTFDNVRTPNCGRLELLVDSRLKFYPLCPCVEQAAVIAFFRPLSCGAPDAGWLTAREVTLDEESAVRQKGDWYAAHQKVSLAAGLHGALNTWCMALVILGVVDAFAGLPFMDYVVPAAYVLGVLLHGCTAYVDELVSIDNSAFLVNRRKRHLLQKGIYVSNGLVLLVAPLVDPMFRMQTEFSLLHAGRYLLAGLVLGAATFLMVLALRPQLRRSKHNRVFLACVYCALCLLLAGHCNRALDPYPAEPVTAVIELRDNDACLVLEDGHSHFLAYTSFDDEINPIPGTTVSLLRHRGLLDIPYLTLNESE